jgi:hypothetical protein
MRLLGVVLAMLVVGAVPIGADAADPANSVFTPLKAPDCVTDTSSSFFVDDSSLADHPTLPQDRYFMVVRHMGADAAAMRPDFDFSRFPDDYGWVAVRGHGATGFAVPDPKQLWQRASQVDATIDTASAFQLHCLDAGTFINSWTFPATTVSGGGPHAIYGFIFGQPPSLFDLQPGTDFVLQAAVEVPWFAAWPDPGPAALYAPVGQVAFYAYVRDRVTGKTFALIVALFDNRAGPEGSYPPAVAHDGQTPFATTPLNHEAAYAHRSPYSATYTGVVWTGLRYFRVHVSQAGFRRALADVNAYCRTNLAASFCADDPRIDASYSGEPANYDLTGFGIIHEIFRGGMNGNVSMGVHVYDLGAWNAR